MVGSAGSEPPDRRASAEHQSLSAGAPPGSRSSGAAAGAGSPAGGVSAAEEDKTWLSRELRKIVTVIALALIAVGVGVWAVALFPPRQVITTPSTFSLRIFSSVRIYGMILNIARVTRTEDRFLIFANTADSSAKRKGVGGTITLDFANPTSIVRCPAPADCRSAKTGAVATMPLGSGDKGTTRAVTLIIRNSSCGFAASREMALVQTPTVNYTSHHHTGTMLEIYYNVPAADNFEWSVPPDSVGDRLASWNLSLSDAQPTQAQTIVGTDSASQDQDNFDTFIAGVLLGVAGGAAIAVVQEVLHMLPETASHRRRGRQRSAD